MKEDDATQYEKCVSCGEETKVPVDQHVDFRNYYVEGAGQICEKCYINIYGNIR